MQARIIGVSHRCPVCGRPAINLVKVSRRYHGKSEACKRCAKREQEEKAQNKRSTPFKGFGIMREAFKQAGVQL
jgi:predicted RNA-binding Zn-ribbon protein involved in translation (DUF1610 family)